MMLKNRHKMHDLPYVWPFERKEVIFDKITESNFNHVHLVGEAGAGKSRCLYELLELFKKDNSKEIIDCSCYDERNKNTPILEVISDLTLPKKDINTFKNPYDLIEHYAQSKDIVIIIDDFHYEQDTINHFIEKLVYKLSDQNNISVTLITASRKEFPLKTTHNFQRIRLDSLSSEEISILIEKECGKNKTLKMLQNKLLQESKGNPLYITEAVNIITQMAKDPLLKINPSDFSNINNIDDLYRLILLSLSETQQKFLKAASIVGKKFSPRDITLLLPEHKNFIEKNLKFLCEKKILIQYNTKGEYGFTHDKQLENTYKNINVNDKWAWHLTQAKKYKKRRRYDLCAYHYYFSESYETSIKYLTFTARKALKKSEPVKAELYFKRAFQAFEISYLSHKLSYFKLQIDYCYLLLMQGRLADAEVIFLELKNNSNAKLSKMKNLILGLEIKLKWMSGNHDKHYSVSLLDDLPKSSAFFTDRSRLIGMLSDIGEHQESIKRFKELLKDIEKETMWRDKSFASTKTVCHVMLAINYLVLGDKNTASQYIASNIKTLNSMEDGAQKIHILTFTAEALHMLGEFEKAKPLIKKAYELNMHFKIGNVNSHILAQYAHNLAFFGHVLQALELFDECISFNESNNYMLGVSYYKMLMAKTYSSICMERVAIDILKSAEKIALKQKNDYHLALIYYELSLIGLTVPSMIEDHVDIGIEEYLSKSMYIAMRLNLKSLTEKCEEAYKCMSL